MPAKDQTIRYVPGTVEPGTLYLVTELKSRTGIGSWALRSARRDGLRIIRKCGRNWILGADFIAWLLAPEQGGGR